MNIRTEQVQALLRQQELAAKKPTPGTDGGFDALLATQMGEATQSGVRTSNLAGTGLQSAMVGQMLLASTENSAATGAANQVMEQFYTQTNSALDMWDSYVNTLGGNGESANLRQAYALLDGLDTQVGALKQNAESVLSQNPQLASIINELEVMSATEKFKINRGDYS